MATSVMGRLRQLARSGCYRCIPCPTFEEDLFGIRNRHVIGIDNLMWATDYPHPDSTLPESQKVIQTHLRDVPIQEARQIVGGNAARFYRL